MPSDTGYAMHGDLDETTVLQWVQKMTTQHAPPDIRRIEQPIAKSLLQAVLNGYAGEMGVYLTLDAEKRYPYLWEALPWAKRIFRQQRPRTMEGARRSHRD